MRYRVTIDAAGRILIPKALREEICLRPGDAMKVTGKSGEIVLAPVSPEALIRRERGVRVLKLEPTQESIVDLIDEDRDRRMRELMRQAPGGETGY